MFFLWLLLIVFLGEGSSLPAKNSAKENLYGEYIYRHHDEFFFIPDPPSPSPPTLYPWEQTEVGGFPRVTKDFFVCKGNLLSPVVVKEREGKPPLYYRDCEGIKGHGLPLRGGEEFIYPCLLELLNYIQEKTCKKVVITCGHRCPEHNAYADPSPANWGSKHMLGAEVDFYVEGLEKEPLVMIDLIQRYYKESPLFVDKKEYTQFKRFEGGNLNVTTPPWYNKEVFVKLYLPEEGRDGDNQHGYPYVGIQVRYDREGGEKVVFEGGLSQNYLRH